MLTEKQIDTLMNQWVNDQATDQNVPDWHRHRFNDAMTDTVHFQWVKLRVTLCQNVEAAQQYLNSRSQ